MRKTQVYSLFKKRETLAGQVDKLKPKKDELDELDAEIQSKTTPEQIVKTRIELTERLALLDRLETWMNEQVEDVEVEVEGETEPDEGFE